MNRIVLLASELLLFAGITGMSQPARIVQGAPLDRKICTTVKKKVHGKIRKVRVCHPVTPPAKSPTPTATATAIPIPAVSSTPTRTPTASPIFSGPRIVTAQSGDTATIVDHQTGNSASADKYACGTYDDFDDIPSDNTMYLWIHVSEKNIGYADYTSWNLNFQVTAANGEVFDNPLDPAGPPQVGQNIEVADLTPDQINAGWIEVTVPLAAGVYTVAWNESDHLPATPFATYHITPFDPGATSSDGSGSAGTCPLITP